MNVRRSWAVRSATVVTTLSLVAFALPGQTARTAVAVAAGNHQTTQTLKSLGTTSVSSIGGGSATASGADQYTLGPSVDQTVPKSGLGGNTRLPAAHVPTPAANAITGASSSFMGFNGITHRDQRLAGTGSYTGTQFSLEPPDQGLCVGNGYVIEAVNNAMRVYTTAGVAAAPTVALSQFFHQTPEIIRSKPPVYGEFISDPRCYYDATNRRWFLTELGISTNAATGSFQAPTIELIAVSQTSNPTGSWSIFSFDTTDDGSNGTLANPGCPCFGDQPLIGADANGFYISTNEFPVFQNGFNGSQLYAISKQALESAASSNTATMPTVVHINVGTTPTPDAGGIWYSLQPAEVPPGSSFASANNGTEYLLSALQFFSSPSLDSRIAVWALTGTSTLATTSPSLTLTNTVVSTESYGQPGGAQQEPGATPFGSTWMTQYYGFKSQPEELLSGNDDRMNQVQYVAADNTLWGAVNTVVQPPNGPTRVGIAYFAFHPSVDGTGQVSANVANQGYVAANQEDVLFPAIALNSSGQGAMTFTLVGPDYYPSAAYTTIDATHGAGDIHIASPGTGPDDGFTGYAPFGSNRTARWGDYSAAATDEQGHIWIATEYIPSGPRTLLANWGTYVGQVTP